MGWARWAGNKGKKGFGPAEENGKVAGGPGRKGKEKNMEKEKKRIKRDISFA